MWYGPTATMFKYSQEKPVFDVFIFRKVNFVTTYCINVNIKLVKANCWGQLVNGHFHGISISNIMLAKFKN